MADLVSLADVKAYVRPEDATDDAILGVLISWASARVRSYTQRLWTTPPVVDQQRAIYFTNTRTRRLDDPLNNVTEIIAPVDHYVEGEPYPFERVLDATEYELQQTPIGTTLRLDEKGSGKFLITGDWGWASEAAAIPEDIEMAVILAVDEWYRSNILSPRDPQQTENPEGRNLDLPDEVRGMLNAWALVELIA